MLRTVPRLNALSEKCSQILLSTWMSQLRAPLSQNCHNGAGIGVPSSPAKMLFAVRTAISIRDSIAALAM